MYIGIRYNVRFSLTELAHGYGGTAIKVGETFSLRLSDPPKPCKPMMDKYPKLEIM